MCDYDKSYLLAQLPKEKKDLKMIGKYMYVTCWGCTEEIKIMPISFESRMYQEKSVTYNTDHDCTMTNLIG
jgi:hypothetical protein